MKWVKYEELPANLMQGAGFLQTLEAPDGSLRYYLVDTFKEDEGTLTVEIDDDGEPITIIRYAQK